MKALLILFAAVSPHVVWSASNLAIVRTNYGTLTIKLYAAEAPRTVGHFIELVNRGTYQRTHFYRVVRGEYIQGGIGYRPARNEKSIQREGSSRTRHVRGTVGFAWEDLSNPNSGTTEIYICIRDQFALDKMGFTAFGRVVNGLDVLDEISNVPVTKNWKYLTRQGLSSIRVKGSVPVPWHIPVQPVVIEAIDIE
jgi:peptidyl-prolyl cis-trans isomerase A (cyclophilin A)